MKKLAYIAVCLLVFIAVLLLGGCVLAFSGVRHLRGDVFTYLFVGVEFSVAIAICHKIKPYFKSENKQERPFVSAKMKKSLKHNTAVDIEGYGICRYDGWYDGKFIFLCPDGSLVRFTPEEIEKLNTKIQQ